MYLEHFHLKEFPFRLTPDFDFFFMSESHARAKAYLEYTVVSKDGFVVITGEIGAGKTTLLNMLINEMRDNVVLAHINQTQLNEVEFLQSVLSAFGLDIGGNPGKVELLNRLRSYLERQVGADRRVVLAIDEAQSLSYNVLEQIRMLSGMESNKSKLMSVILMGQPELDRVINSPELEQLSQRVRLRFHLGPLNKQESRQYVRHRLTVAGARSTNIFTDGAYDVILDYAGGIPRLINSLCDMALLAAYVDDQLQVSAETVKEAAKELEWPLFEERQSGKRRMGARTPRGNGNLPAENREREQFEQVIQTALASMAVGFEGLREELKGIENRLAEVVRRLKKD